jgi:dihydrofolate reductase
MGSVIWHATISLDGFLAGPDDDLSWFRAATAPIPAAWDLVPHLGALVAGRRTHDVGLVSGGSASGSTGGAYGGAWRGPVFVPTSRPAGGSPHPDVVFVDGVAEAVRRAREAAGDRDIAVFGGAVGSVALGLGLVDELMVHVVPVLLGRGIRLYPRTQRQAFEVLATSGPAELTSLRLRPLSPGGGG